jgi:hypothetical protein
MVFHYAGRCRAGIRILKHPTLKRETGLPVQAGTSEC